ncbi:hypothetical protein BN7_4771 [Wickerhamomyces ciferrii]|uniref:Uncharacterized protein n=1 Tax=Wickerhamomyces ciferrii (strain ATCC 14091 / BCRC 22168 / CBS 111 / JCM 3599 / NBRC 0793 / NRRL Y-1031 F-60-10) TaxID=1206466 RepID=K0KIZ1_WICCF|nr:uncharacterized protein BN7_4771 [Wickerhamomyces ciferrii]CCH45190.1 hypothetical protein BN7_4771 [Wickerhamomyces ciferrii]
MKIEKYSEYIIEISAELYDPTSYRYVGNIARHDEPNNLLIAKSPKNFKLNHETFNNLSRDKAEKKLARVFKKFPKPVRELSLIYKSIEINWQNVDECMESTCKCQFFLMPGYDLKDCLIEILSNLIKNFQSDIPDFLNTECFGNGLEMVRENKLLMIITHEDEDDQLPLRIILESLISYVLSDEYEEEIIPEQSSYDHEVKAYEFNYQDQLKLMVIWGEKAEQVMLEQLNYMISNDVLSEPSNANVITLIPSYLNYNVSNHNDELPPSYGSSVLK